MMVLTIKKENVKGLIKHYSLMLKVAKTEVQKEFYAKQLELHKKILDSIEENEIISKYIQSIKNKSKAEKENFKNKIFSVEIDQENNHIIVLSKRKSQKGKGFAIPLHQRLLELTAKELEMYIANRYLTSIYKYC